MAKLRRRVNPAGKLALYSAKIHRICYNLKIIMQAKSYGVDRRREVAATGHFHQGFHSVCAGEHPALRGVLAGRTLRDEGLWRGGCPTLDLLLIVRRYAVGVVEQGGRRVHKDDVLVQGAGHAG